MDFVPKRLFDIDDDLLARAQAALGTPSMTATVREALRRVVTTDPGAAYVELLRSIAPEAPDVLRREMWSGA